MSCGVALSVARCGLRPPKCCVRGYRCRRHQGFVARRSFMLQLLMSSRSVKKTIALTILTVFVTVG
jgi:hypothetical protein